jgi:hypothetical protein
MLLKSCNHFVGALCFEAYWCGVQEHLAECMKHLGWVNLSEKYINEASSPIRAEIYTLSKFLGARNGVG